jgi:hypothetical protein
MPTESEAGRECTQPDKMADLLAEMSAVSNGSARIEEAAQSAALEARRIQDLNKTARVAYVAAPAAEIDSLDVDQQLREWRSYRSTLERVEAEFQPPVTALVFSGMSMATSMVTTYALFDADAFSKSPELDRARRELYKARDIPSLLTEITGSLERLSLDVAHPGQHTIADLLSQAHAALARPVLDEGRAISTLVPIRSAIDEVFAALGRRCPGQQRMKGWPKKVLFVGGQCARPGVTSIAIEP